MKIYVSHSSGYDYDKELYLPIEQSSIVKNHKVILPHKVKLVNTKEIIAESDLVIAEVSLPTTGQGIELGWADFSNKPILCIHKLDSKISSALKFITKHFIEYKNEADMIEKVSFFIDSFAKWKR